MLDLHSPMSWREKTPLKQVPGVGLSWRCAALEGETAPALPEPLTVEANELSAVYEKHICSQQRDEPGGNAIKGLSLD